MSRTGTDPLEVYTAYGASAQRAGSDEIVAGTPFAGADRDTAARATQRIESVRGDLERLAIELHDDPEIGFEEHRSVARIAELLARHGYEAEVGAFGLDTAFRATVGTDGPHFAIVAEYDALPGIGHACGHNIIAGIAAGAFIGLAPEIARIGGRLSIIGTPAEEGGGGKEHVIRAGGFDDVDAAGMVHPSVGDQVSPVYGSGTSGVRRIRVRYRGRAGHAALSPYLGLNALDAVVTAYQSIAQLRQHILPIDRIHGIITNGGAAANVVPELTEAEFLIRSTEIETLKVLTERVIDILEAAALATGTTVEIDADFEPPYLPLKQNVALVKHWARHLEQRGRTVPLTPARATQGGPSTDMGNVSWLIPAIHPALGLGGAPDVLPHNAAFAASTVEPAAFDALVDGASALAGLAADYLVDAELREAALAEFEQRGGRRRWER
ncbi:amidohydrolase [Leucobacter sp. UCD-THU]|uniref:Peptidase M20 domain-containing protein 2 n=1 Tax=Leucobacter muris TaxID=1935379 RepID=A0ABX5QE95_9MICO|nr:MULTISPECIES: amidohydrolase [Leucobacter]EYT52000.1 amidohydrolase [Leucobacter sp. UCD-THU]QAB17310.1 M20 family peptidase [Leucobacter muris]